jgi:hypothetical protein
MERLGTSSACTTFRAFCLDIKLTRKSAQLYGILGEISNAVGEVLYVTLEHAYKDGFTFVPKLAPGVYTCKRGIHRLSNLNPFEAFEVMGVPDFQNSPVTGILIHVGNYNNDSEGCILIAMKRGVGCILDSGDAFKAFMASQEGCDEFTLTVS